MDAKIVKLDSIEKRYLEIGEEMLKDDVVSNVKAFTKLSKEQATLKGAYDAYQEYKKLNSDIEGAKEMLNDSDPELKEMAQMEYDEASEKLEKLNAHIDELLLPRDPEDAYDCLVEIRGAAGGDEGNIFAGDLYRMYNYYAANMGFKTEVMEVSESEAGGYALISFSVKGQDAYRHFKFESGAHRVQRVPKTETQGRVHTSTATVFVLPDVEDEDVEIPDSDLEIETHRASGAGGQHINKTESAVRITHIPTGTVVASQAQRSQLKNREQAMSMLKAKLYQLEMEKKAQEAASLRGEQMEIGWGSQIRSYVFHPYSMVKDHRTNYETGNVQAVMDGDLDGFIDAYLKQRLS